jgi:hypothetical protein
MRWSLATPQPTEQRPCCSIPPGEGMRQPALATPPVQLARAVAGSPLPACCVLFKGAAPWIAPGVL